MSAVRSKSDAAWTVWRASCVARRRAGRVRRWVVRGEGRGRLVVWWCGEEGEGLVVVGLVGLRGKGLVVASV
jgi:hypothetical protein